MQKIISASLNKWNSTYNERQMMKVQYSDIYSKSKL